VIVAACEPAQQVERLRARGLDDAATRQRIASQLPIEEKVRRADYVVKTGGSYADTEAQVRAVHAQLLRRFE
jgi:dephospho-CoA kinase